MNIFVLDENPKKAAEYHSDRHVVKMLVEYAQILSTAAHMSDFHEPERMYKPVMSINRKVHEWAAETYENYVWLLDLAEALHQEYQFRYGGVHSSYSDVIEKIDKTEIRIPQSRRTEFGIFMPDIYKKDDDPVRSYRNFYIHGKGWDMAWTKRGMPDWYEHEEKARTFEGGVES